MERFLLSVESSWCDSPYSCAWSGRSHQAGELNFSFQEEKEEGAGGEVNHTTSIYLLLNLHECGAKVERDGGQRDRQGNFGFPPPDAGVSNAHVLAYQGPWSSQESLTLDPEALGMSLGAGTVAWGTNPPPGAHLAGPRGSTWAATGRCTLQAPPRATALHGAHPNTAIHTTKTHTGGQRINPPKIRTLSGKRDYIFKTSV